MGLFDGLGDLLGINPEASTRSFAGEVNESVDVLAALRPKILKADREFRPQSNQFDRDAIFRNLLGDEYGLGILDLANQASGMARGNELGQIGEFSGQATDVLRQLDPGGQSILDQLIGQTQASLDMGGASALDRQRIREATRSAQAARGVGYSPADTTQEAVNLLVNDEQARMRRRAEASGVLRTIADNRTNPIMRLLQGASGYNMNPLLNLAGGINASSALPLDPYASRDVAAYNANAINAAEIARANNAGAMAGTIMGGAFDLAGATIEGNARNPGNAQSIFSFLGF